jgi:hypothetical protein
MEQHQVSYDRIETALYFMSLQLITCKKRAKERPANNGWHAMLSWRAWQDSNLRPAD